MKRQIQHPARWPPGKRHWVTQRAFFLLSDPESGPKTWELHAAARGKACGVPVNDRDPPLINHLIGHATGTPVKNSVNGL